MRLSAEDKAFMATNPTEDQIRDYLVHLPREKLSEMWEPGELREVFTGVPNSTDQGETDHKEK